MSQRGSVRKRGTSWTAYWRVDTPAGERQQTKGGFGTKAEASKFINQTLQALAVGEYAEPNKMTLDEYLVHRWMPLRAISLRPSTLNMYEVNIRVHVAPSIGRVKIQQLTPDHLDGFYTKLVKQGLSPKTVRNIHVMLHKALKDAVRKNIIPRNVADAADPPKLNKADKPPMKVWEPADLHRFFEGMKDHRLYAAYLLAATTGMRRGEVIGLRWQDVNFDQRYLEIFQTVLTVSYEITYGKPKTARGQRKVTLDPETIVALREHQARQRVERKAHGSSYIDNDLVFARDNGEPIHPDYFSQTFDRTVLRLGLPKVRLHDLRHTHATLGLASGVSIKAMSDRLGHATTAFTMDVYTRTIDSQSRRAADQIAEIYFPPDAIPNP